MAQLAPKIALGLGWWGLPCRSQQRLDGLSMIWLSMVVCCLPCRQG